MATATQVSSVRPQKAPYDYQVIVLGAGVSGPLIFICSRSSDPRSQPHQQMNDFIAGLTQPLSFLLQNGHLTIYSIPFLPRECLTLPKQIGRAHV